MNSPRENEFASFNLEANFGIPTFCPRLEKMSTSPKESHHDDIDQSDSTSHGHETTRDQDDDEGDQDAASNDSGASAHTLHPPPRPHRKGEATKYLRKKSQPGSLQHRRDAEEEARGAAQAAAEAYQRQTEEAQAQRRLKLTSGKEREDMNAPGWLPYKPDHDKNWRRVEQERIMTKFETEKLTDDEIAKLKPLIKQWTYKKCVPKNHPRRKGEAAKLLQLNNRRLEIQSLLGIRGPVPVRNPLGREVWGNFDLARWDHKAEEMAMFEKDKSTKKPLGKPSKPNRNTAVTYYTTSSHHWSSPSSSSPKKKTKVDYELAGTTPGPETSPPDLDSREEGGGGISGSVDSDNPSQTTGSSQQDTGFPGPSSLSVTVKLDKVVETGGLDSEQEDDTNDDEIYTAENY